MPTDREDYFTHTEADAGEWERHRAEPDDDRPTLAELLAEERLAGDDDD